MGLADVSSRAGGQMTDDTGPSCGWPRARATPDDGGFDVMWARPGLMPFLVSERSPAGKKLSQVRLFGTIGLSVALFSEGHDVVCPVVRDWRRSAERHSLNAAPMVNERALWPSYVVVRWNGPPSQRVRRWFASKVLGWGTTAGQRWSAPAGLVEPWRGYVEDRTRQPAKFAPGDPVDVVDGPWRGQRMTIKSSRRGKDGVWIYECDMPPILTQIVSPLIAERDAVPARIAQPRS